MEQSDIHSKYSSLTAEKMSERIYLGFSRKYREQITQELITEVLSEFDLSQRINRGSTQKLFLHRLVFSGEKMLNDEVVHPFRYDQTFAPGVNILLIPDNNVGKSSVMKTIKFALTGDDSAYDADIKSWIKYIWLHFSVGDEPFTIHMIRNDNYSRAILVAREDFSDLESATSIPNVYFDVFDSQEIQLRLQQFFFDRFDIHSLSWTQGVEKRSASWKTFLQALVISDSSDQYLLCDPQHSYGNQEGLIFSIFLGLQLSKTLNDLGIESSILKKQNKLTDEEIQKSRELVVSLESELKAIGEEIRTVNNRKNKKLQSLKTEPPIQRLSDIENKLIEVQQEDAYLANELENLSSSIKRFNSRARGLREAISLKKHFTGLEVLLCPNCDSNVDEDAIHEEYKSHTCRLCNKPTSVASAEEIEELNLQALDFDHKAKSDTRRRNSLQKQQAKLKQTYESLQSERSDLQKLLNNRLDAVISETSDEDKQLANLYAYTGQIKGQLKELSNRTQDQQSTENEVDIRQRIIEKARQVLRNEATSLNESVLARLSNLVQEMATVIGVESIDNIQCSSLGKITFRKYNSPVKFTGIQNPGERFRVKLAFFISMMRLGREPGLGRHPGFLMIDQLGASEMVPEDCQALARVLKELDRDLNKAVQLICFTARPEFSDATDPNKIYGPQSDNKAF